MTDPLDLTIVPIDGPVVEFDTNTIIAPSMEAPLAPLWKTPAELDAAKQLIADIEVELRDGQDAGLGDLDRLAAG